MRSRYSGFVCGDSEYLLRTWHPDTRPSRVTIDQEQRWLGLKIKRVEPGLVEFVARFKRQGKGYRLHECSRFEQRDGLWYYRDGEHL